MARKKAEIQLQREIETQEEWEEVMAMEGLWVVDVYQEWCGPCQALVANFRRLKNEVGDPLLNFAMAKADTIDALEKYRGRCEPTFLFFAGGILTSYIHGADAPLVQKLITEQLALEHKVLDGTGERKEVKDPVITRAQEIENERLEEEEALRLIEGDKDITIAIIKPNAYAQGKAEEIMSEIKECGFEILAKDERELSADDARKFYAHLEDEVYFDDLVKALSSGPCYVMVLTRQDLQETMVKDWRNIIGPANVEQAREEAPSSWRAKYGEKGYMNGLHGSSSKEQAARELAFFFPNFKMPTYKRKKLNIQRTLALIRPEAFATQSSVILHKIEEAGFKIAMMKEVHLTKEQAAEFYKEHEQYAYFDSLVENMSSGPVLALGLARDDAIAVWRQALGPSNIDEAIEKAPKSLRAQFPSSSGMNQFHGSDSEKAAKEELAYFFPMEQTVAVIKPDAVANKDEIIAKIHESGFRIAARQETTINRNIAEILYPQHKDEPYYEDLINYITSGPSLFMVLSREGAVSGWRQEMGDTDPEAARNKTPESLRALLGKNILHNAVHGSSNVAQAKREMKAIFGDLKFNEDGTVKGHQPDLEETAEVLQRSRSSEEDRDGYKSPDHADTGERAEQDVLRGESQQDDETNNAAVGNAEKSGTPEANEQSEERNDDQKQADEHSSLVDEPHVLENEQLEQNDEQPVNNEEDDLEETIGIRLKTCFAFCIFA